MSKLQYQFYNVFNWIFGISLALDLTQKYLLVDIPYGSAIPWIMGLSIVGCQSTYLASIVSTFHNWDEAREMLILNCAQYFITGVQFTKAVVTDNVAFMILYGISVFLSGINGWNIYKSYKWLHP